MDERNRLIIPAIDIIQALQPEWVILENVSNMVNTLIYDENNILTNIIDYIKTSLGDNYFGNPVVVDAVDYGVPQHRKKINHSFDKKSNGKK